MKDAPAVLVRGRGVVASAYEERRPDLMLIFATITLAAFGVLMVYSASAPRQEALGLDPTYDMRRQVVFALVAAVVFLVASLVDHRTLHTLAPVLYGGALVGLAVVLTDIGQEVFGSQRWIPLGSFQLQPSELAKPAIIVLLAALLAPAEEAGLSWRRVGMALAALTLPSLLILNQPDLGTMLVFGFIGVVMLFAAGMRIGRLLILAAAGTAALASAFKFGFIELQTYQLQRLTSFLNPGADPLASGYSQTQSQIAIGSGEAFGKGLFAGTQTNLKFVPAQTTDFIFTAVGEQLGFIGGVILLLLYAVIVWRLLRAAGAAPDRFGMLVATGTAALLAFHIFVNIGMTLGIMPVTGLPLPFMSSGGSASVAFAMALGFTHSIWLHRSKIPARSKTIR